jgi:hypothetical protein
VSSIVEVYVGRTFLLKIKVVLNFRVKERLCWTITKETVNVCLPLRLMAVADSVNAVTRQADVAYCCCSCLRS